MVCIIILLLFVPGMVTWKIAGGKEPADWKDACLAVVGWLVHDLVIACLVYAAFYIMKGAKTVSFSTEYLGDAVYYSVYDVTFVFRYSALALLAAAGLGVFERLAGKLFHLKEKRMKCDEER